MDLPAGREVCAGISLKGAGDMGRSAEDSGRFSPGRAAFLRAAGLAGRRVFASRQVHSQEVLVVGEGSPDEVNRVEADGLLTDRPDALLTVTVADCLPIFLVDPERGVIGLLHSGWQGTGIVERAVRLLASAYGSDPAALRVTIGPGIGGCCYRVDAERAALFRRRFGDDAVRAHDDGPHLDLRAANLALLERLGVSHVTVVRDCTACSPPLASYRRDGAAFVRMLAFIGAAGAGRTGRSRR
jgi:hypothetical protein